MSAHNKVIWSEGLFIRPQHFQQQDRAVERYVETRCQSLIPHSFGFAEIELERDLLAVGKLAMRRATGVFPDGTPFRMPEDDPLPPPLDVGTHLRDQIVHLAVPLRGLSGADVDRSASADGLLRHDVRELEVRDTTMASGDPALIEVAALRTRLVTSADVTAAFACLPFAHVIEVRADKTVVLHNDFMPSVLHVRAASPLATFAHELQGLLHQRGEALAGRVAATGRGGAAEIADFLLLQVINRFEPLMAHHTASLALHPEEFFRVCVALAGELATFTTTSKRPPAFNDYRHERLRESFEPVILSLRSAFSAVIDSNAIPIPIEERKFGIRVAIPPDRGLYSTAAFILAARADVSPEELRRKFPAQLKVGPVEKIRDLVNFQLPGVDIHPLPVAPRQIPYHAGSVYFEFDQTSDLWRQLQNSGGIAMHLGGEFPGLVMEFWALR